MPEPDDVYRPRVILARRNVSCSQCEGTGACVEVFDSGTYVLKPAEHYRNTARAIVRCTECTDVLETPEADVLAQAEVNLTDVQHRALAAADAICMHGDIYRP